VEHKRILILDGDPAFRDEVARALTERGFSVRATGSAEQAVALLPEGSFVCALVDVELEDMPGLEAVPLLRKTVPGIRVIVTARENNKQQEAQVRESRALYYYVKNFDRLELFQAITAALRGGK